MTCKLFAPCMIALHHYKHTHTCYVSCYLDSLYTMLTNVDASRNVKNKNKKQMFACHLDLFILEIFLGGVFFFFFLSMR